MSNNELISFSGIFSNFVYRIPDYQRGYAWGNAQLADFWEDLINLPDNMNHYTGMLSLEEIPREVYSQWSEESWVMNEYDFKPYYVVDGQQRLTTFVIFVQSFVDYILSLPENDGKKTSEILIGNFYLDRIIEDYLYIINKRSSSLCAYKFGYCDDPSYNFLKKTIMGRAVAGGVEETFYTHNLSKAKRFFDENIKEYGTKYGHDAVEKIFRKATKNLKFKQYFIDDDFDVYAAFETMNNRGKKLSNLELLKSRLIYLTTLFDDKETSQDERDALRKNINETWKEIYKWLGNNREYPLQDDEFLRAHWIIRFQYTRKRGTDYVDFLLNNKFTVKNVIDVYAIQEVDEGQKAVEDEMEDNADVDEEVTQTNNEEKLTIAYLNDYVLSLSAMASQWYYSFYPQESGYTDDEKIWIDRLNRLGIAYFRPLIVASFMTENITSVERIELFQEIERFIFIAFRLNGAYSTYHQNQINAMVRRMYNGEITTKVVIDDIHKRIEDWVHAEKDFDYYPFVSRMQRLYSDGNGFYSWGALRYVLYEYEEYLHKKNNGSKSLVQWKVESNTKKVSIEHIFPQNPSLNGAWGSDFSKYDDLQKHQLKNSLGNLLLLSVSKNAQLQNDEFVDKKNGRKNSNGEVVYSGYDKGSYSEAEVASNYTEWTANEIKERGIEIVKFIEKRWNIAIKDDDVRKKILFIEFL